MPLLGIIPRLRARQSCEHGGICWGQQMALLTAKGGYCFVHFSQNYSGFPHEAGTVPFSFSRTSHNLSSHLHSPLKDIKSGYFMSNIMKRGKGLIRTVPVKLLKLLLVLAVKLQSNKCCPRRCSEAVSKTEFLLVPQ